MGAENDRQDDHPQGEEESLTFETALAELESLVETMEDGELSLEEALRAFERGMKLQTFCQAELERAEQKVRILTGEEDTGEEDLAPFSVDR